jgi:hypothetical protein
MTKPVGRPPLMQERMRNINLRLDLATIENTHAQTHSTIIR